MAFFVILYKALILTSEKQLYLKFITSKKEQSLLLGKLLYNNLFIIYDIHSILIGMTHAPSTHIKDISFSVIIQA